MEPDVLFADVQKAWLPPPRLRLSEWADQNAVLSAESSAEVGRWRSYPFQRGIMDAISDRKIERVTVMKSARVGWTKMINHAIGYHMHHDPCPILVAQPTIGDAEGYSKDEIGPMIRDTPALAGLIADTSKRDSGNTIVHKVFRGGSLRMVGADSPRGFRRVSIRLLCLDEVDGYAATAGEEGDQIKLAIRRTDTFWNRKILIGSTPTLEATSRVNRAFLLSDQRYYFVPCPHCRHPQVLRWENLRWEKGKPETVLYHCEHCGVGIEYRYQRWMVEEAYRLQREGDPTMGWVATNPNAAPGHAGFHIWAAYSYSPNATWEKLAAEWIDSHKNTEERKTFINTVLGLPFKGDGDAPDWKRLYDRRESYRTNLVPAGGLVLFAGVDVQRDRLEVEIVAYGRNMESWSVDYRVIPGDTSNHEGADSPWRQIDELLNEQFDHERGGTLAVRMMAIDSGDQTQTVYGYCRNWPANRVLAVKGRDTDYTMLIGQPTKVEVSGRGKKKLGSLKLWPVGSGIAKTELYGWLKQERPTTESGAGFPFGYCHFPEYPEQFFRGITAEEIVPRLVKGYRRYQWEKVYERNEPLDCRVYARAASSLAGIDRWKDSQWTELEQAVTVARDGPAQKPAPVMMRSRATRARDPYLD